MQSSFFIDNLKVMFIENNAKLPQFNNVKMPDKDSQTDRKINFYNIKSKTLINPGERKILRTGIVLSFDPDYQLMLISDPILSLTNGILVISKLILPKKELFITLHNCSDIRIFINENQKIAEGVLIPSAFFAIQKVKNIE